MLINEVEEGNGEIANYQNHVRISYEQRLDSANGILIDQVNHFVFVLGNQSVIEGLSLGVH